MDEKGIARTPAEIAKRLRDLPEYKGAKRVLLYVCYAGKRVKEYSKAMDNKPTRGPDGWIYFEDNAGMYVQPGPKAPGRDNRESEWITSPPGTW